MALGVSPATLLLPNAADAAEQVSATGLTEKVDAERLGNWLRITEPVDPKVSTAEFLMAALPAWMKRNVRVVSVNFSARAD